MPETEELREVVLVDVPLELLGRSQERQEGLLRELTLVRDAGSAGAAPARLLELSSLADQRYGEFAASSRDHLLEASRQGLRHTTVTYRVPASAGRLAADFLAVLREVDEHCRSGLLLTVPPAPDMAALRDRFLGEFPAQLAGAPPTPCRAVRSRTIAKAIFSSADPGRRR